MLVLDLGDLFLKDLDLVLKQFYVYLTDRVGRHRLSYVVEGGPRRLLVELRLRRFF